MAVGDIEQLVDSLVNRGLVSPKMVGRAVGQATINELQNLGRNVGQSQATLQQQQSARLSQFQKLINQNRSSLQVGLGGGGGQRATSLTPDALGLGKAERIFYSPDFQKATVELQTKGQPSIERVLSPRELQIIDRVAGKYNFGGNINSILSGQNLQESKRLQALNTPKSLQEIADAIARLSI